MFCPARHSVELSPIADSRDDGLSPKSSPKKKAKTARYLDSIQSGGATGMGLTPPPPDEQNRYSPITIEQITEASPLNQVLPNLRAFMDNLLPTTARMPLALLDMFWGLNSNVNENPHQRRIKLLARCNKVELFKVFEVFGENLCSEVLDKFEAAEEEVMWKKGNKDDVAAYMYEYFTSSAFVHKITVWGNLCLGRASQWRPFREIDTECEAWPFGETTTLELLLSRNKTRLREIFGDPPEAPIPWPSPEMQYLLKYIFGDHLNRIFRGSLDRDMTMAEGFMANCIEFATSHNGLSLEYGLGPYKQENENVFFNVEVKLILLSSRTFIKPNEIVENARGIYYGRSTWDSFIQAKIASQNHDLRWHFLAELEVDVQNLWSSMYLAGMRQRPAHSIDVKGGEVPDELVALEIPWERQTALVSYSGKPYRRGAVAFENMTIYEQVNFLNLMLTRIANFFYNKEEIFTPTWTWHSDLDHLRQNLYQLYYRVAGTIRKPSRPDGRGEEREPPLTRLEMVTMVERFLSNEFPILPREIPIQGLEENPPDDYVLRDEELVRRAQERIYKMHQQNHRISASELADIFVPHSPATPQRDTGDGGGEEQVLVSNVIEHRPTSEANAHRFGEASHPGPLLCDQCAGETTNTCDMCKRQGLCIKCEKDREYCTQCAPIFASYANVPMRDCISCASSTQHWCSNCEKDGEKDFLGVQMGRPYCHRCFLDHPHCPVCSPEPKHLLPNQN